MAKRAVNTARHSLQWGISSGRLTIPDLAFVFWFVYQVEILTTVLFFQSTPKNGTALNFALAVSFVCILALIALMGMGRLRRFPKSFGIKVLFAFVLWSGISLAWTQAAALGSAFGFWAVMAAETVTVFVMCCMAETNKIALRSLQGIAVGGLAVAAVAVFSGFTDVSGRVGEAEFLHPNSLGYHLAIAALSATYLTTRSNSSRTIVWMAVTSVLIAALLSTLSKTSIPAFGAAFLVYLITSRIRLGKKTLFLVAAAATVGASYTYVSAYLAEYFDKGGGETFATLSGRILIWESSWEMIQSRPVLGYGFMAFRDTGPQIAEVRLVHAHNEAINLWFSLGAVGLILAVLLYVSFFWRVQRAMRQPRRHLAPQASLGFALLTFTLIEGLTEAQVTGLTFPLPLLVLMFAWVSPRRKQNFKTNKSYLPGKMVEVSLGANKLDERPHSP